MKRINFQCTLLTDLIMSSSPATEGFHESLDYIPGAKFLGAVARSLYDTETSAEITEQTYHLFHSGKVRFGDALPVSRGEVACPVPFSWYFPKNDDLNKAIYLAHYLDIYSAQPYIYVDEKGKSHHHHTYREYLIAQGIQPKQARDRYIIPSAFYFKVEQDFTIKSAYDRKNYRSKEEQMYGYYALQEGSVWQFSIDIDEDFDVDHYKKTITEALKGHQRLGRSSSAQYGLVDIQPIPEIQSFQSKDSEGGQAYIYALSNLCFLDDDGNSIFHIKPKDLGLPEDREIDWNLSRIRTRTYQTWNKKRNRPNRDRKVIERGSVFVLKKGTSLEASLFEKGVGSYRSEGFGQVLLNPSFLMHNWLKLTQPFTKLEKGHLKQSKNIETQFSQDISENSTLLAFLAQKRKRVSLDAKIDEAVNQFIRDHRVIYSGLTTSQWGQIRNIVKNVKDISSLKILLFDKKIGFLYSGQSKTAWGKAERISTLEDKFNALPQAQKRLFLIKLAIEMSKTLQTA